MLLRKKVAIFNKLVYTMGMKNSDVTQPAANRNDLPHHRFDIVAKDAIYTFPEDVPHRCQFRGSVLP